MRPFPQYGAMESAGAALRIRHALSLISSSVGEPARRASAFACSAVIAGPWPIRFTVLNEKNGVCPHLSGELQQDVPHRLRALLPGGQLDVDAQAVRPGEARGAAFLADEVEHLAAVERRAPSERVRPRPPRGIHAADAHRAPPAAHLRALE